MEHSLYSVPSLTFCALGGKNRLKNVAPLESWACKVFTFVLFVLRLAQWLASVKVVLTRCSKINTQLMWTLQSCIAGRWSALEHSNRQSFSMSPFASFSTWHCKKPIIWLSFHFYCSTRLFLSISYISYTSCITRQLLLTLHFSHTCNLIAFLTIYFSLSVDLIIYWLVTFNFMRHFDIFQCFVV